MGTFLTLLGIALITFGTASMYIGNTISTNEYKKEIATLVIKQAESIKVHQAETTQKIVTQESDLRLIIQNLSKMEKWDLLMCVRDPATLFKDGAVKRMLIDRVKEIDRRFITIENPLQDSMDSLVRKGLILWNNEDAIVRITPLGAQVIEVLLKDKIYPFDFDHKYLRQNR